MALGLSLGVVAMGGAALAWVSRRRGDTTLKLGDDAIQHTTSLLLT